MLSVDASSHFRPSSIEQHMRIVREELRNGCPELARSDYANDFRRGTLRHLFCRFDCLQRRMKAQFCFDLFLKFLEGWWC